jgi:16S rRNA (adenine1518-N6/adenine1519-N6)-dimethyltransferase
MKAKKSLGQNFLRSKEAIEKIASASNIQKDESVLEVGPGEGVLTEELLRLGANVIAVEKDDRLIPELNIKFRQEIEEKRLKIIHDDALNIEIENVLPKKYKIVANIPYYITGQLLRKFLSADHKPELVTLLLQKEVAERIVAKNGKESILSLAVKIFGSPKYIGTVNKSSFAPQPKVDSAILRVDNIDQGKISGEERDFFFKNLHLGFGHKRKLLLSNLSATYPKEKLENLFKNLNLNLKVRAEDINIDTWLSLSKGLKDIS